MFLSRKLNGTDEIVVLYKRKSEVQYGGCQTGNENISAGRNDKNKIPTADSIFLFFIFEDGQLIGISCDVVQCKRISNIQDGGS